MEGCLQVLLMNELRVKVILETQDNPLSTNLTVQVSSSNITKVKSFHRIRSNLLFMTVFLAYVFF